MSEMKYNICAKTNMGLRRTNNEDNLCINNEYMRSPEDSSWGFGATAKECVAAVCDGMGGESFGEFASLCAVSNIACAYEDILDASDADHAERVDALIQKINREVCDEIRSRNTRIGATVAMLCIKDDAADLYNIGDSRIYLLRSDTLTQLSKDHTIVQRKLDIGAITAEQAEKDPDRHKLTQHIGIFESEMIIEAHHVKKQVLAEDVFLICSDGLTDMVSNEAIQQILTDAKPCDDAAERLMETALANGGKDNISIIVVQAKKGLFES